jgi:hypothetical protein
MFDFAKAWGCMLIYESEGCLEVESEKIVELYRSSRSILLPAAEEDAYKLQAVLCLCDFDPHQLAQIAFYCRDLKRALKFKITGASGQELVRQGLEALDAIGLPMEAVNLKLSPALRQVVLQDIPGLLSPEQADRQRSAKQALLAEMEATLQQDGQGDAGKKALRKLNQVRREEERLTVLRATLMEKFAPEEMAGADEQSLSLRNAELAEQLAETEAMLGEERTRLERTERILTAAEKRIRELEENLVDVETSAAKALKNKQDIVKLETRIEDLTAELNSDNERVGAEQEKQQQLAADVKVASERAEAAEKRHAELETELEQTLGELAREKSAQSERGVERQAIAKQVQDLQNKLQLAEEEATSHSQLAGRLEAAEARIGELSAELAKNEARLEKNLAASQGLEQELTAARKQTTLLEKELKTAEKKISKMARDEERIADFRKRLEAFEKDQHASKLDIEEERDLRKHLEQEVSRYEKQVGELESKLAAAEQSLSKLSEQAAPVADKKELSRVQAELREAVDRAEAEALSGAALNDQLQEAHGIIEGLEKALKQARLNGENGETARLAAADSLQSGALAEKLKLVENRLKQELVEQKRSASAVAAAQKRIAELEKELLEAREAVKASAGSASLKDTVQEPAPHTRKLPHELKPAPKKGTLFRPDWELAGLPCKSADQVVEAWESMFNVQLSLEGYPSQYCTAFLVIVETGENRRLFMLFRLKKNNHTLVMVPAEPPADDAAMGDMLREGKKFLQLSGFVLEQLAPENVPGMLGGYFLEN